MKRWVVGRVGQRPRPVLRSVPCPSPDCPPRPAVKHHSFGDLVAAGARLTRAALRTGALPGEEGADGLAASGPGRDDGGEGEVVDHVPAEPTRPVDEAGGSRRGQPRAGIPQRRPRSRCRTRRCPAQAMFPTVGRSASPSSSRSRKTYEAPWEARLPCLPHPGPYRTPSRGRAPSSCPGPALCLGVGQRARETAKGLKPCRRMMWGTTRIMASVARDVVMSPRSSIRSGRQPRSPRRRVTVLLACSSSPER